MIGDAPSMAYQAGQTGGDGAFRRALAAIETVLEGERDQLVLWLPVALGAGIAGWYLLDDAWGWAALLLASGAVAAAGFVIGEGRRLGRVLIVGGIALGLGCALIWARADRVAAPVLRRPTVASFTGSVEQVQRLVARDSVRVLLRPIDSPQLPPRVRVNIATADAPAGLAAGDRLRLRARLVPPPPAALPGAYDFAQAAWFQRIGATGKASAPVERIAGAGAGPGLRDRLSAHIQAELPGGAGAIAAALATGDQGAMPEADAEAMRRSGLAHLLSVSGLHITAVVAFTMVLVRLLLALSPALALRWPLLLIAAGAGALAGIGYTLLTGAEVPTIRSCVAALLVLGGLALGREALTLRLVAAGAIVVLLLWPESVVGASFQLSFAAVTAIVAFHEHPSIRAMLGRHEEGLAARGGRLLLGALLTGLAVEIALAPIALFHFHKSGLYGAAANIVAIPLTTFVIMPLEALALLFDAVGIGAPFWWATGLAMNLLLWIAHAVSTAPGAIATLAAMPRGAFALIIGGGLWMVLWRSRWRWWGTIGIATGIGWSLMIPPPDLLITGDGRHVAVRAADGSVALLRTKAGDYVRDLMGESAGHDGETGDLDTLPGARCGLDTCAVDLDRGGRRWRVFATRSAYLLPVARLARACRDADIVVSERRLPRNCRPRWLKIDRPFLASTGGLTIALESGRIRSVAGLSGRHPWVAPFQ